MDISRTMPQSEKPEYIDSLFDGTTTDKGDWPFGRTVQNVEPGDFLYVIYRGRIHGRFRITRVEPTTRTVEVGTEARPVQAKTVVWVKYPGELAGTWNILRKGHRGHRYDDVPEWMA
jgi:hypothetical protein